MDPAHPSIDELQKQFETLAPAPRIGNSLRTLIAEGNVNPDEILPLIRLEPLLATRILREANLLQDKCPQGYLSIEEAATAIGFRRMYELIGLYSYQGNDQEHCCSSDHWKCSITAAVCMESLASKHKLDPQRAYAIGLIHSLAEALVVAQDEAAAGNGSTTQLNNRLKKYNHSGLCYALLSQWGLPSGIVDPIRFQYSPLDCQTTGKMACLLNLAKWITGVVREVDELPDQALGPDLLVLNLLGEGEQTLWNLVTDVSDSLHAADCVLKESCRSSC